MLFPADQILDYFDYWLYQFVVKFDEIWPGVQLMLLLIISSKVFLDCFLVDQTKKHSVEALFWRHEDEDDMLNQNLTWRKTNS